MDPNEKRLAVLVDDHDLAYIDFEGIIRRGMYGAGPVVVWDSGTLKGKTLKGTFTLVRLRGRKEWLLIKQKDEFAIRGWKLKSDLTPEKLAELEARFPNCETS